MRKNETTSFVIRFTQKIFQSEDGEPQVQWRGNIRHVQGDDEKNFSEFDQAVVFIQEKLTGLTVEAIEGKSPEDQRGILAKSFDLWKRVTFEAPKMLVETIKDPQGQVAHLQEQFQQQVKQVKEDIGHRLELNNWMASTKADYDEMKQLIQQLSDQVAALDRKIDALGENDKSE